MPLFRLDQALVYFAHVPKCGGTTMTHYLNSVFGACALQDSSFGKRPKNEKWSYTSPQHMDARTFKRIFPDGFVQHSFAIVRDPVARLVSVYRFQRDIEERIAPDVTFEGWLDSLDALNDPWAYDNHVRPMDHMVPKEALIFRLEEGFDPVLDWLQSIAGPSFDLPRVITPKNVLSKRLLFEGKKDIPTEVTASARAKIQLKYEVDFARFGYTLNRAEFD